MSAVVVFVAGVAAGLLLAFAALVLVGLHADRMIAAEAKRAEGPKCTCRSEDSWHAASCDLVGAWAGDRGVARGCGPVNLAGTVYEARARP